jgi:hypothetical protein
MENNILDKDKDKYKENTKFKILNWEEFNQLKNKDSNLQFYSISDKNSISDMQFYFSKENSDYFFLSKNKIE